MCGTKNFSSVRWYSAPQLLHLTIVAISGICAPAHQFSSTDCGSNQTAPLPGDGRLPGVWEARPCALGPRSASRSAPAHGRQLRRGTGRSYRSVVLVPFHPLRRRMVPLIWLNGSFWLSADRWGMKPPEEPRPGKVERPPKLPRSEDARRIIQEYIDNLREIIKKFRRRLN